MGIFRNQSDRIRESNLVVVEILQSLGFNKQKQVTKPVQVNQLVKIT